ncbi:class I SAM-dependent methyltransferase, partial [Leclercia adecarboxylata]|uniref:class I SAM-dependent methyltransferase n=1 Tax=Leclercia adecarboxylata TaxID=83655 RepID=UPI00234CDEB3
HMSRSDSTERFSSRVADYVRYRPDYPPALLDWLHQDIGVPTETLVADIGAGTGISTRLFLAAGHPVIAVEPNAAMREAAEQLLAPDYLRLRVADGTAEATGLADNSVGLVAAAQAFHWFDATAVRREWARILQPEGMALVF